MSLSRRLPGEITVKTADCRQLLVDTGNISYKYVYFLGEYEPAISRIFKEIINPGDICFDIGANIGWYTTLFQKLVGEKGEVHAFEPVPFIFEHLNRNVKLNEPPENVRLNNLALGDVKKDVDLHLFPNLPNGHASISNFGRSDDLEVFSSRMTTLDTYLSENSIGNVSLIKIDIEGAELMMLKGASKLFDQIKLPVFEIEMALATTSGFGYLPNDLIEYIRSRADFRFFAIHEKFPNLREIRGFDPDDIGANVLCLPPEFDVTKVSSWMT